jgi:hypothetical protein
MAAMAASSASQLAGKAQVDEAGSGNFGAFHQRIGSPASRQSVRPGRADWWPCALGQHHRGIGGQIAMRRIARRLDRDIAARASGGQVALGLQGSQYGIDPGRIGGVKRVISVHARAVSLFAQSTEDRQRKAR